MKRITILLSSVLTLLLITSNNTAYAALNYEEIKVTYKPNTGNVERFNPKQNRLGDDITTYGYKNILKKGNVFRGNVRILPNRNSGERFNPISKYSISDEPSFIPKPNRGKFNPISKYSISDEPSFIPKPNRGSYTDAGRVTYIKPGKDGFIGQTGLIGENGKVGLSVGPIGKNNYSWKVEEGEAIDKPSPKGVQLKFINGEWR